MTTSTDGIYSKGFAEETGLAYQHAATLPQRILALVKSLVQRLNEPLLASRQALPGSYSLLRGGGTRKVRLAGPHQQVTVMQVKTGPESGASYAS